MASGGRWVIRLAGAAAVALPLGVVGGWLMIQPPGGPNAEEAPPRLFQAPDFALVDQAGDTLRAEDLRGIAWVASFIFSHCESVCPLITARMAELRDTLSEEGLLGQEVRLVSITVDPARDSVTALREYAAVYGGSPPSEWAFLTGAAPEAVRRLVEEGFKVAASLPPEVAEATANYQVQHTPRIELVDRWGWVRGAYDTTEPGALDRLRADLARVLGEKR